MAHPDAHSPPTSFQEATHLRFGEVRVRNRGRLPHWEKDAGLYFLTFHLADSLPNSVLKKIAERHQMLAAVKGKGARLLPEQKELLEGYSHRRIEEYFDRGSGSCALGDPRIAGSMASALRFWHGKRYRLLAWCIMPNHVHVVARLFPGQELAAVMKSWKLHAARAANQALGRSGRFWQREYYDHLLRSQEELDHAIRYVLENPAKAGLSDWAWVWGSAENPLSPPQVRKP
jgi:REP element-mobilizing transposase RayT